MQLPMEINLTPFFIFSILLLWGRNMGSGGGTGITFETLSNAFFKKSLMAKPANTLGKSIFF